MGSTAPRTIGRYSLCGDIAAGGMATVHYGRLLGPAGFSRTVAIKRLHAQYARDPDFVSMFMDEARLAARVRHPNVVPTLDVVALEGELFLVMDYVAGEALSRLIRATLAKGQRIPIEIVSSIVCGTLHGLHAAHDATAESGEALGIVHRDVSPQNVLVGSDGIPRVLDFGVAKAAGRTASTRDGQVKGKFAYMAPEQIAGTPIDRRADVYAVGVVLWEVLTLQRLFVADNDAQLIHKVMRGQVTPPSDAASGVPKGVDGIVMRALAKEPAARFSSAREMALELEGEVSVASPTRVSSWIEGLAHEVLVQRAKTVAQIESNSSSGPHPAIQEVLKESLTPTPAPVPAGDYAHSLSSEPKALAVSPSSIRSGPDVSAPRRSHGLLYGAGAVIAIGALAFAGRVVLDGERGGAALFSTGGPRAADSAAAVSARAAPTPTSSSVAAGSSSPSATPSGSAAEDAPPASASAAQSAMTAATAPPAPKATIAKPAARPPATKPRASLPAAQDPSRCTIKSFVDDQGIEHFSKECN